MLPEAFFTRPIAHRGLHDLAGGRPENGLSSMRAAARAGYGIELDLQLSSDGEAMVFHDYELDRLTGRTGQVKRHSATELAQMQVLGTADTVSTLGEVLEAVAGRVPLLLELKDQSRNMGEVDGRLERATAAALANYQGPAAVMSFNPASVAHLAEAAPGIPRGITTGSYDEAEWQPLGPERLSALRDIARFDAVGASFVSHYWKDLEDPAIARLKARGIPVLCWTIRSPEAEAKARQIADNITFEGYLAP